MKKLNAIMPRPLLPAFVLNKIPMVIVAFELDFLNRMQDFRQAIERDQPFTILLQLGWSVQAPGVAQHLNELLKQARQIFPEATIIILANEPEEINLLDAQAILCNHNALLDPQTYPLHSRPKKTFDAIYVARITPFKRHDLAAKIPNLQLVGNYSPQEKDYAHTMLSALPHATWTPKVHSWNMSKIMGEAACGLALSATEGAMFSCGEYSLAGIPVVTTPNLGGRNQLLPDFAQRTVEPTPNDVAQAVNYWKQHPLDPIAIRNEFIRLATPHRQRLQELLKTITGKSVELPHKLGVRRHLNILERLFHSMSYKFVRQTD